MVGFQSNAIFMFLILNYKSKKKTILHEFGFDTKSYVFKCKIAT